MALSDRILMGPGPGHPCPEAMLALGRPMLCATSLGCIPVEVDRRIGCMGHTARARNVELLVGALEEAPAR